MRLMTTDNEHGFIMVWVLLLLVVVTLLGIAGVSTSIFEDQMAGNEALHKQAFYEADGGTQNGLFLLFHNISCIDGFSDDVVDGNIAIEPGSSNFWMSNNLLGGSAMASDVDRDFYYPSDYEVTGSPHTNGRINGITKLMTGANLPMMAGYEGKGKALGADGAFLLYDVKAEYQGYRNSRSCVSIQYRLDNQFANYPSMECVY